MVEDLHHKKEVVQHLENEGARSSIYYPSIFLNYNSNMELLNTKKMTGRNYGIFRNFTFLGRVTNCWNASVCRTLQGGTIASFWVRLTINQYAHFGEEQKLRQRAMPSAFITPKRPLGQYIWFRTVLNLGLRFLET